jgi:hypothetical protein
MISRHCSHATVVRSAATDDNSDNQNDDNEQSDDNNIRNNRRRLFQYSLAAAAAASPLPAAATTSSAPSLLVPTPPFDSHLYWPLGKVAFSLLPLAGGSRRATVQETIVPNKIWTHDQIQGIVNVNVPVRQTTIALQNSGGLWVHNPVAPTLQHLQQMKQLEQDHGPVQHIVLGTVALEHKATFGAFARKFPKATVWIQPGIL